MIVLDYEAAVRKVTGMQSYRVTLAKDGDPTVTETHDCTAPDMHTAIATVLTAVRQYKPGHWEPTLARLIIRPSLDPVEGVPV